MDISDLTGFLDEYGFEYKENDKSVIMKACPNCEGSSWKTYLQKDRSSLDNPDGPLLGKCYKCGKGFSSISYLLMCDVDTAEVMNLHGRRRLTVEDDCGFTLGKDISISDLEDAVEAPVAISDFISVQDWIDHPAAQYAIKRGLPKDLYSQVLVDFKSCSVVFICSEGQKVVGYQKRLLYPPSPHLKAMSSRGFKKSQHILEFARPGSDIVVVEGPFTGISGYQYGYHAIVTFGAGVSGQQLKMIADIAKQNKVRVAVGYDLDKAGMIGFYRICNSLDRQGVETYRIMPEFGNDLNDSWVAGKGYTIQQTIDLDCTIPYISLDLSKVFL